MYVLIAYLLVAWWLGGLEEALVLLLFIGALGIGRYLL
jgi:hypothetical protein